MKSVILATLAFIFVGTYSNYVDRHKPLYTAQPLVEYTVPSAIKMGSDKSENIERLKEKVKAARSRTTYENPNSKDAIDIYKQYVKLHTTKKEYECYDKLIFKESSWNPLAQNPKSTAFGLGQFIDKTWDSVPQSKTTNPYDQLDAMFHYVEERYGDGCTAWNFWKKNNWY